MKHWKLLSAVALAFAVQGTAQAGPPIQNQYIVVLKSKTLPGPAASSISERRCIDSGWAGRLARCPEQQMPTPLRTAASNASWKISLLIQADRDHRGLTGVQSGSTGEKFREVL